MAWKPQPWRNLMPRHCKSLALKKIKQRNWLRAPPETLDLDCQRRFFTCQVLGLRIFFLNRKPKSAIGVSSDPKPILNPTLVHLLCLGLQYCLWEYVAVFGWMGVCVCVTCSYFWVDGWVFVCVCACMQAILCVASNYEPVDLQILQHGIRICLPSIRVFQDCGAEPARLGGPAILVSVLVLTFHTCPRHACTFIPLIPTYSFSCLSFSCCNTRGR
jgi:hypothetical protein